jgi:hypothetical protein
MAGITHCELRTSGSNSECASKNSHNDASHALAKAAIPIVGEYPAGVAREGKTDVKRVAQPTRHQNGDGLDGERLNWLQQALLQALPAIMHANNSHSHAQDEASIKTDQEAVQKELKDKEFGPATQSTYYSLISYLEQKAVPEQLSKMSLLGVQIKASKELGFSDPNKIHLGIDPSRPPSNQALDKLIATSDWIELSRKAIDQKEKVLIATATTKLTTEIKSLNLPQSWLKGKEADPAQWISTTDQAIQLALQARSYIETADYINFSTAGAFPIDLPPNTTLIRDSSNHIRTIKLDLPSTMDPTSADYQTKMSKLSGWLKIKGKTMEPILQQIRLSQEHPEQSLFWGDQEVQNVAGRFDRTGSFLGLAQKGEKPGTGEHFEDTNLVRSRMDVKTENGRVVVKQTVQADVVPWLSYQNLTGVTQHGKDLIIQHSFAPSDWLMVKDLNGEEFLQAKDLQIDTAIEKAGYYGSKALMGALDVAMTATGVVEIGLALKAARVGARAADLTAAASAETAGQAGKVVLTEAIQNGLADGIKANSALVADRATEQALLDSQSGVQNALKTAAKLKSSPPFQIVHGALKASAGLAGIVNNAGARDTAIGADINDARSVYFVADTFAGLGLATLGKTALGKSFAQVESSQTLEPIPANFKATLKAAQITSQYSQYGFTALTFHDIYEEWQESHTRDGGNLARLIKDAEEDSALKPQ